MMYTGIFDDAIEDTWVLERALQSLRAKLMELRAQHIAALNIPEQREPTTMTARRTTMPANPAFTPPRPVVVEAAVPPVPLAPAPTAPVPAAAVRSECPPPPQPMATGDLAEALAGGRQSAFLQRCMAKMESKRKAADVVLLSDDSEEEKVTPRVVPNRTPTTVPSTTHASSATTPVTEIFVATHTPRPSAPPPRTDMLMPSRVRLANYSQRETDAIIRMRIEGYSVDEIARTINRPPNSVRTKIKGILAKQRQERGDLAGRELFADGADI